MPYADGQIVPHVTEKGYMFFLFFSTNWLMFSCSDKMFVKAKT
jgi:hypothetical protein